jgi:hypothetical protein
VLHEPTAAFNDVLPEPTVAEDHEDTPNQIDGTRRAARGPSDFLHALRNKLREIWDQDSTRESGEISDTEDFRSLVRRLQLHDEYKDDGKQLLQEIAADDHVRTVDAVRDAAANLQDTLELVLVRKETEDKRSLRRQIKNFAFFLRSDTLRSVAQQNCMPQRQAKGQGKGKGKAKGQDKGRVHLLLTQRGQAELMDAALSKFGTAVENKEAAAPNIADEVAERVSRLQNHPGKAQFAATKRKHPLKDQLKKARQRVNWDQQMVEWVTFQDILDEVQAQHNESDSSNTRLANIVWEETCFTLEVYAVDGGRKTKAEALKDWTLQGFSQSVCFWWWDGDATPERLNEPPIPVNEEWKKKRMQEMMAAQGSGQ